MSYYALRFIPGFFHLHEVSLMAAALADFAASSLTQQQWLVNPVHPFSSMHCISWFFGLRIEIYSAVPCAGFLLIDLVGYAIQKELEVTASVH